jgi:hypothetical protein
MTASYRRRAAGRAVVAGLLGMTAVVMLGPELLVPSLALVALVYFSHHLAAVLLGHPNVPNPGLAFVIVVNSLVVLAVQVMLVATTFSRA